MSIEDILSELYAERARIDAAIKALKSTSTDTNGGSVSSGSVKTRKRHKLSKEARARIALAQKARWARQKSGK